jgi:hypothetical protein
MSKRSKKANWQVDIESVYVFGREERLQSAFEATLPNEKFKIEEVVENAIHQSGTLCSGIQRKAGARKDN